MARRRAKRRKQQEALLQLVADIRAGKVNTVQSEDVATDLGLSLSGAPYGSFRDGTPVTEADISRWADEAERGYDLESLRETRAVLSDPALMRQLAESKASLAVGDVVDEAGLRALLTEHNR